MTDKELLELAAKAAEIEIDHWRGENPMVNDSDYDISCYKYWNPLTDDGDALRLAVKLGIQVLPNYKSASGKLMTWAGIGMQTIYEPHDEDTMEATRRAIVKAAALIWEELK